MVLVLVLVLVLVFHRKIRLTHLWVELSWVVAISISNCCNCIHSSLAKLSFQLVQAASVEAKLAIVFTEFFLFAKLSSSLQLQLQLN